MDNKLVKTELNVKNNLIKIMRVNNVDYISLTDLARYKNPNDPSDVIKKWLSNYDSIEFLGLWEQLSNDNFNSAEFRLIKDEAPSKSFTMTPSQWCTRVNAIAIASTPDSIFQKQFCITINKPVAKIIPIILGIIPFSTA